MGLEPGQTLDGKYRIVQLIGEGGMGAVFEGLNSFINRKVAIKVLHAAAAGNEQVLRRFEREAQAAGTIGSDHILEVIDLGTLPDGDRYMVMEFLEGEELTARIKRKGQLAPDEVCNLVRQTLVGLKAAHAAQIIHRDLKPDNIFILREKAGRKDFVKIIDFGISKFNALASDMSMTTTGAVMGTPYYMSPEQAKGSAHVDARTDLYAVGVIMYQSLTGNVPFDGTSFNDLMFKIVLAEPPQLSDDIPAQFRAIVMKAMARNADERYQTADEFIAAIDQYTSTGGATAASDKISSGFSHTAPGGRANDGQVPSEGAVTTGNTEGNFAQTQAGPPVPRVTTNKTKLPLILGAAAIVLLGGLAFALSGGSDSEESAPSGDVSAAAPEKPDHKVEPEKQEKSEPKPDEKITEEPPAQPEEKKAAVPPTAEPPAPKVAPAPSPVALPRARPTPTPKPKPKPKPAPGGRDFGY